MNNIKVVNAHNHFYNVGTAEATNNVAITYSDGALLRIKNSIITECDDGRRRIYISLKRGKKRILRCEYHVIPGEGNRIAYSNIRDDSEFFKYWDLCKPYRTFDEYFIPTYSQVGLK